MTPRRWTVLLLSLAVGGFYVYASVHKIADPPDFAKSILNYKLVPWYAINLTAIFLPWFELLGGLAVITGIGRRGGSLGLGLLSIIFALAIGYNLYRGHPTFCGCFSKFEGVGSTMTDAEKFFQMKRELVVNSAIVVATGVILALGSARKKAAG